jgi:hypothetical protein
MGNAAQLAQPVRGPIPLLSQMIGQLSRAEKVPESLNIDKEHIERGTASDAGRTLSLYTRSHNNSSTHTCIL